jgi:hypothetical protein
MRESECESHVRHLSRESECKHTCASQPVRDTQRDTRTHTHVCVCQTQRHTHALKSGQMGSPVSLSLSLSLSLSRSLARSPARALSLLPSCIDNLLERSILKFACNGVRKTERVCVSVTWCVCLSVCVKLCVYESECVNV